MTEDVQAKDVRGTDQPDSPFAVPLEVLEGRSRVPAEQQVAGVPLTVASAYVAGGLVPYWAGGGIADGDGD